MAITLSLKHRPSDREEPCSTCGAAFASSEDSGSRLLAITVSPNAPLTILMCGGCYSKWSHGTTMTTR